MDLEERRDQGELGEVDGGEIVVWIYCMREESVCKKRKEYKENKCMDPCLLALN